MGTNIQLPPRKLGVNSTNYYFPSMFHLNRVGNGNDDISIVEQLKNLKSKKNRIYY
jgi:hypothetical protein